MPRRGYFKPPAEPVVMIYARKVLDVIEKTENEQGEVAHLWSAEDGHPLEYDSFSGCWGVAALALYCKVTGDMKWLDSCARSLRHYHSSYVRHQECYGTPHDT